MALLACYYGFDDDGYRAIVLILVLGGRLQGGARFAATTGVSVGFPCRVAVFLITNVPLVVALKF